MDKALKKKQAELDEANKKLSEQKVFYDALRERQRSSQVSPFWQAALEDGFIYDVHHSTTYKQRCQHCTIDANCGIIAHNGQVKNLRSHFKKYHLELHNANVRRTKRGLLSKY